MGAHDVGPQPDNALIEFPRERYPEARERLIDIASASLDHDPRRALDAFDALQRIAAGTYGACANCGCIIPAYRLILRPEVLRCLGCQLSLHTLLGGAERCA